MAISTLLRRAALILLLPMAARAMSVLPPSFDELVDESSVITRGTVINTESFVTTTANGTSVIKTRVTWSVEKALKGSPSETYSLEFLGGRVDGQTMAVPGMPTFRNGDHDYLFVGQQTKSACPLLAGGHGRYRILTDAAAGIERIARQDGTPLTQLSEIKSPLNEVAGAKASLATALTSSVFESSIQARLEREAASQPDVR